MRFRVACFFFIAAVLPALASEGDFGLLGITSFETARLNAYCDGSVVPTPCDVVFEFEDLNDRTLKESSVILQPGTSGFLDFAAPAAGFAPSRVEIKPCFKILRGTAQPSVEVMDNFFQRTRLRINWADGATPHAAEEVEFGILGLTRFDIARMGASCEGDGSVMPTPCDITFEFHDASDAVLKSARLTLEPGTSGFLDIRLSEIGSGVGRVLITPCFDIASGLAVLDVQTIDIFSNLTVTQGYPAAVLPAVE